MRDRGSIITLLSNYACQVAQRGARRMYFDCSGIVATLLFAATALVAAVSLVTFVILVRAGGDATRGLLFSLMALSLAVWSAHIAVMRYRRHGSFELDGEEGVFRRYRAGRMTSEFSLSQIARIGLVLDPTDGLRVTSPPSWLQVVMETGEIFRLAKGSRQELAPVFDALREVSPELGVA